MSENNESIRPKIEDEINDSQMDDLLKKNALDFVAYLRANGMTTDANHSKAFKYMDKFVCILDIYPVDNIVGWTIIDSPICTSEYNDFPLDEHLKEFAWEHVTNCVNCGCGNRPGTQKILGKEFDNVCTYFVVFRNPDAETLQKVIQLIEVLKHYIDENVNK